MQYEIPDDDKRLFQALTATDRITQVNAATNLEKIGRWDVLSWIAHKPGMLQDVRHRIIQNPKNLERFQKAHLPFSTPKLIPPI